MLTKSGRRRSAELLSTTSGSLAGHWHLVGRLYFALRDLALPSPFLCSYSQSLTQAPLSRPLFSWSFESKFPTELSHPPFCDLACPVEPRSLSVGLCKRFSFQTLPSFAFSALKSWRERPTSKTATLQPTSWKGSTEADKFGQVWTSTKVPTCHRLLSGLRPSCQLCFEMPEMPRTLSVSLWTATSQLEFANSDWRIVGNL